MFKNRYQAALKLAAKLENYRHSNAIVLAVPRGGVPIGYVIARQLHLPMELVLSKKIGHPLNPELAIGSVSLHGTAINKNSLGVPSKYIHSEAERILDSLKEKYRLFMGNIKPTNLNNKTVIIVDDGIATGSTILATVDSVKKEAPAKIIIAVPVAPAAAVSKLEWETDKVISLLIPDHFRGVGQFYEEFTQVSDEEVVQFLRDANNMKNVA